MKNKEKLLKAHGVHKISEFDNIVSYIVSVHFKVRPDPDVIKLFSRSTQLCMAFYNLGASFNDSKIISFKRVLEYFSSVGNY